MSIHRVLLEALETQKLDFEYMPKSWQGKVFLGPPVMAGMLSIYSEPNTPLEKAVSAFAFRLLDEDGKRLGTIQEWTRLLSSKVISLEWVESLVAAIAASDTSSKLGNLVAACFEQNPIWGQALQLAEMRGISLMDALMTPQAEFLLLVEQGKKKPKK